MNFNSTQRAENKRREHIKKARREMNLGLALAAFFLVLCAAGCDTGHAERPAADRTAARAREKRENKKVKKTRRARQ